MTCRTRGLVSACVLAFLAAGAPSAAQAQGLSAQLRDFVQSKSNREAIQQVISQQIASWPAACRQVSFGSKFDVVMLRPAQFSADGRSPLAGAWKETLEATACGVTRVHNVLSLADRGDIQRLPMLVGTSRADIMLQKDAAPLFFIGASRLVAKECRQNYVTDTQFVTFEGAEIPTAKAGPKSRAWSEEWTLWSCGRLIVVPIRFIPDATGTAISVSHGGVREKQP